MSKLIPLTVFQARNGLGSNETITVRASAALEAASLHIEAYLRTEFIRRVDAVDLYWIDSQQEPWREDSVVLYLKSGFVEGPVLVKTSDSLIVDGNSPVIPSTQYLINQEHGLINLPPAMFDYLQFRGNTTDYDRLYMQVTYTSGFELGVDAEADVYQNVPDWLQEASYVVANLLFDEEGDCATGTANCTKIINEALRGLLERHIRFFPVARKPVV